MYNELKAVQVCVHHLSSTIFLAFLVPPFPKFTHQAPTHTHTIYPRRPMLWFAFAAFAVAAHTAAGVQAKEPFAVAGYLPEWRYVLCITLERCDSWQLYPEGKGVLGGREGG